jgi:hypothetical protein
MYVSESCAISAGFTSGQCCKLPKEVGACPSVFDPLACSTANCVYDNSCIAELAGFDPNSCVKINPTTTQNSDSSGAFEIKTHTLAATLSFLALLTYKY